MTHGGIRKFGRSRIGFFRASGRAGRGLLVLTYIFIKLREKRYQDFPTVGSGDEFISMVFVFDFLFDSATWVLKNYLDSRSFPRRFWAGASLLVFRGGSGTCFL